MKKALFVIDMQEDCVGKTARKPFPLPNSKELITNTNKHIQSYINNGDEVIYICEKFPNTLFFRCLMGRLLSGTEGAELSEEIIRANAVCYEKVFASAFSNKGLIKHIEEEGITDIELTGLDTTACVAATAIEGKKRGLNVTILSDAIATVHPEKVQATYKKFRKHGVSIL